MTLVDVGASGGIHERWTRFAPLLLTVGFEPDPAEFAKLRQTEESRWFNCALAGACGARTLYVTQSQSNTSLLRPNRALLDRLQYENVEDPKGHDIIKEIPVECMTLDDICSSLNVRPDFIKLDTQGTELEILQGGAHTLDDALIVEVEVEFARLYENQPLFADVHAFMRDHGFMLLDLGNFLYVKPRGMAGVGGPKGRLIDGDALYVKEVSGRAAALFQQGPGKVAAALAGYLAYGYPELSLVLIDELASHKIELPHMDEIRRLVARYRHMSRLFKALPFKYLSFRAMRQLSYALWGVQHSMRDAPIGNRYLFGPR